MCLVSGTAKLLELVSNKLPIQYLSSHFLNYIIKLGIIIGSVYFTLYL